jgi:uncharacterized protein YunC (DUF1805 family)
MSARDIAIDGKKAVGHEIDIPGAPLVLVQGGKGFVMCGYLDLRTCEKLNQAAAVVRGVKTVDDLLAKPVTDVSSAAGKLGVAPGMTGLDALKRLL